MPNFTYSARETSGQRTNGSIEAPNRKAALQRLSARGLRPLAVTESSGAKGSESKGAAGPANWKTLFSRSEKDVAESRLTRRLALPFLRNLRELLNCGIQAGDALRLMSQRLTDPGLKLLCSKLWDDLRQGRSLSEAMGNQSKVFDESQISLIEAGEATGSVKATLSSIVNSMEEARQIRSKLLSALAYPAFLIVITIGLVFLFLFSLLPKIQGLLSSLGGKLPLSTKLLIFMANWLLNYGWLVLLLGGAGTLAVMSWRKREKGRMQFDTFVLKIPALGRFLRDLQVLRLTQVLSLLLENGITMVVSLAMTERALSNRAMREAFVEARNKVTEGTSLSTAFKSTGYFDDMALDIFTVGENTGNIVPGLKQMSRQYSEGIDKLVGAFLGAISTVVLLFVFGFVALIAFGIISAVFQLSSSLSGA